MALNHSDDDHFHDECGVFAVFGAAEAAKLTCLGLHALQHRGQESAGIATVHQGQMQAHRGMGLVQDVFHAETLAKLPGDAAIGHVRYSTAGGKHIKNAQPLAIDYAKGSLAVAHNGNLTNGRIVRQELEAQGSIFSSISDTEVVVHLIARSLRNTLVERVVESLHRVEGAYSMAFLSPKQLIVARDAYGFRPLCMGRVDDAYVFASEPPALELVGGRYERDVKPGEVIVIDAQGLQSIEPFAPVPQRSCIFEHVYFARPDATLGGINVYEARKRLGTILAQEQPVQADVVVPVPDSGVASALGFARQAGLPFELGLIRSHYIGRTFIEPQQSIRLLGVKLKLHPVRHLLAGKRVAVIDDSIVRGTTSQKLVRMIRDAGAAEVHLRISSPPTRWPCFYGIDTPSQSELLASTHSPTQIATHVEADSVGYLSVAGLHRAVGGDHHCDACFSGNYPVPPRDPHPRALPQSR